MYFEASLFMGHTPLNLPEFGRTFSLSIFGYTIALNVCTTPVKVQKSPLRKIDRTLSSCPCVPVASECNDPCNQEVCKVDTNTRQTEIQSVEEDHTDTCNSNHTKPLQDTESTAEQSESTVSSLD